MNQTTEKRVSPRKSAAKVAPTPVEAKAKRTAVTATAKKNPLAVAAGLVQKFYVFIEGARPVSGPRLAAHTNAALLFLGLAEGQEVKKEAVLAIFGTRAVKYHRDLGNFKATGDCLVLTTKGANFFKSRVDAGKVDSTLNAAFLAAFKRGKANDAAQIKPNHLEQVCMAVR
jgi:hypothetical protein